MPALKNTFTPQIVFHPGETLSEKLNDLSMSTMEFSILSGMPVDTINALLKGETRMTQTMAVQFESVLKIPAHFWMNKQKLFDDYLSRKTK